MKIAITGGTGFIGRHLARDLIARGHEVIVISRGKYTRNTQPVEGATFISLDINNTAKLTEAFRGCEAVAHCAGTSKETAEQTYQRLHVDGARVCLGLTAAENLLCARESMSKLRGRTMEYECVPVMVTYHPAALLRNPNWKRPVWEDVQAVKKLHDELIAGS